MDNLPFYEALITDEMEGMTCLSLVDYPAVESDFLAFAGQKQYQAYRVKDEDKHLVHGVVMRADFPIYRYDEQLGEYYVVYRPETIRLMAEKYLKDAMQNNVSLMHDGQQINGIHLVQWYIKDSSRGIVPEGFEDIKDGSLFAEYHIDNPFVWDLVKAGSLKGFSLEGYFEVKRTEFNNQKHKKMSKLKQLLELLVEVKLSNVTTDKGVLYWDGDEDLKAGDEVYLVDADDNRIDAEDGEYRTSDGKVIIVREGVVAEIRDDEAEVAPAAEEDLAEEEPAAEEPAAEEPAAEDIDALKAYIAELEGDNEALRSENDALKAENEELKRKAEEPAGEPASEEFKKAFQPGRTGNRGLDRLAEILNA